jgi:hypothetical protein
MRLTMKEKQSVIRVMQEGYRKACKKLKRQILDECCRLTGYNRGLRFTLAEPLPASPQAQG